MTASEKITTRKEISDLAFPAIAISHHYLDIFAHIEDLSASHFMLRNIQFENDYTTSLRFSTERNVILMQFCVQGRCNHRSGIERKTIALKTAECNMLYIPKGDFKLTTTSAKINLLNIYIDEDFFFKHIPDNHVALESRTAKTFGTILSKNLDIKPKVKNILNDIDACEFDGHLKKLYFKAKIIELLTLQLVQSAQEIPTGLMAQEIEKMRIVKELIENNLSESYSLAYLARAAVTNEQYLKKHFKTVYGNTVFGYMLSCKMQMAKDMLLSGKYRISEIADRVGYKHATHFTNAFKKFFGYLPKMIKTKLLWAGHFLYGMEFEIFEMLVSI